jgi:hypothetical protein
MSDSGVHSLIPDLITTSLVGSHPGRIMAVQPKGWKLVADEIERIQCSITGDGSLVLLRLTQAKTV